MEPRKKSNILILTGIKLDQLAYVRAPELPTKQYTELPKQFISVDNWPRKSNLKCWSCSLIPTSYPKFIPLYPTKIDGVDICDAHGHFCEWSCAARYIHINFNENKYDMMKTLEIFAAKFNEQVSIHIPRSIRTQAISIAPSPTIMKDYRGNDGITEDEYRKKLKQ